MDSNKDKERATEKQLRALKGKPVSEEIKKSIEQKQAYVNRKPICK